MGVIGREQLASHLRQRHDDFAEELRAAQGACLVPDAEPELLRVELFQLQWPKGELLVENGAQLRLGNARFPLASFAPIRQQVKFYVTDLCSWFGVEFHRCDFGGRRQLVS